MNEIIPINDATAAAQTTTYTGTAGTVAGWKGGVAKAVDVVVTSNAHVRVGVGVTATTSDQYIPSGQIVRFKLPDDDGRVWTVSAIQVSAGGSVYAKPVGGV